MRLHFAQVAVIANVVSNAVLRRVRPLHRPPGDFFDASECFDDGTGVRLSSAKVINLPCTGGLPELENETGHILGMDVVANLLTLVAENLVVAALQIAFNQIAQKTMQFDARLVWPCQTASAQTTGRQVVIASILL